MTMAVDGSRLLAGNSKRTGPDGFAGLGACADEPIAPRIPSLSGPNANLGDIITVTTWSGTKDVGSLRWVGYGAVVVLCLAVGLVPSMRARRRESQLA